MRDFVFKKTYFRRVGQIIHDNNSVKSLSFFKKKIGEVAGMNMVLSHNYLKLLL